MKVTEKLIFLGAATASGIAVGAAMGLSRTPVVAAYVGAAMPLVIAVAASLSRIKIGSKNDISETAHETGSPVIEVSKFVLVFFLFGAASTAVAMWARSPESILIDVDQDLKAIGVSEETVRIEIIREAIKSGSLSVTSENTRAEGIFLYSAGTGGTQPPDTEEKLPAVDCAAFGHPPWSTEKIGSMITMSESWARVGALLSEIERVAGDRPTDRKTLHRAVNALIGCDQ